MWKGPIYCVSDYFNRYIEHGHLKIRVTLSTGPLAYGKWQLVQYTKFKSL